MACSGILAGIYIIDMGFYISNTKAVLTPPATDSIAIISLGLALFSVSIPYLQSFIYAFLDKKTPLENDIDEIKLNLKKIQNSLLDLKRKKQR